MRTSRCRLEAVLLHWPLVAAPDAWEGEERSGVIALDGEPVPGCRLHVAVGLAERGCRHETSPLPEAVAPERVGLDLVVTNVGDGLRRSTLLQPHEAPAHADDFALAVAALADHRCDVAREDGVHRLEAGAAIV